MAKTNYTFCLVAFFIGVTLLCNGPSVDANRMLLQQPRWCVARLGLSNDTLQGAIDYFCNQPRVDCNIIKPGGPCFDPDTKPAHASFAINMFFHATGECPSDVGVTVVVDPSYGGCRYEAT